MSVKTVYECNNCQGRITEFHTYRLLGQEVVPPPGGNLTLYFSLWDDAVAKLPNILHFCSDSHAKNFLEHWLDEQREKQAEQLAKAAAPKIEATSEAPASEDHLTTDACVQTNCWCLDF